MAATPNAVAGAVRRLVAAGRRWGPGTVPAPLARSPRPPAARAAACLAAQRATAGWQGPVATASRRNFAGGAAAREPHGGQGGAESRDSNDDGGLRRCTAGDAKTRLLCGA